jgi:hypothetical protein
MVYRSLIVPVEVTPSFLTTELGDFTFEWLSLSKYYSVFLYGRRDKLVCEVHPYKGVKPDNILEPKNMYTVKAQDYPGTGNLEQMVKGSDLLEYVDSLRRGRWG